MYNTIQNSIYQINMYGLTFNNEIIRSSSSGSFK